MSSKQIGEEIFTEHKNDSNKEETKGGAGKGGALSASADDAAKLWPLFCYDMARPSRGTNLEPAQEYE